jgi:hypothetical protein
VAVYVPIRTISLLFQLCDFESGFEQVSKPSLAQGDKNEKFVYSTFNFELIDTGLLSICVTPFWKTSTLKIQLNRALEGNLN